MDTFSKGARIRSAFTRACVSINAIGMFLACFFFHIFDSFIHAAIFLRQKVFFPKPKNENFLSLVMNDAYCKQSLPSR